MDRKIRKEKINMDVEADNCSKLNPDYLPHDLSKISGF